MNNLKNTLRDNIVCIAFIEQIGVICRYQKGKEVMVNRTGTNGNDRLIGSSSSDILRGLGGNDYLLGYSGDDRLYGHDGKDTIKGGSGDDLIKGGSGDDKLYGGLDNDYLVGAGGKDILYGDIGSDKLYGNQGNDLLRGGSDKDTLYGGSGNDYIDGGEDDDTLYGEDINGASSSSDVEVDQVLFSTGFEAAANVFEGWHVHANPESAMVVDAPGGKGGSAVKMSMNRTDEFSGVINGKPRTELARVPNDYMYDGGEYHINFKTYLPSDFQFDYNGNREGLMQIHQSNGLGTSPLFLIGLDGDSYFSFVEPPYQSQRFDFFASASDDRGKWVDWSLHYKASTGEEGLYELYKNDDLVSSFSGANSYHNDGAYIKIGVYKWSWTNTGLYNRTVYYDDVSISISGSSSKDSDTYFFDKGYGTDTIIDVSGQNDTILFGSGLSSNDAMLAQQGEDLEIIFANSTDKLVIKDYLTVGTIEHFEFHGGYRLSSDDINYMIWEMAQLEADGGYQAIYDEQLSSINDLVTAYHI